MKINRIQSARDYNRRLPLVVRGLHVVCAALAVTVGGAWRWLDEPGRRLWAWPALFIALALVVYPIDRSIAAMLRQMRPGGDIARELNAWQQFGALGSIVFTAIVIWLLDPAHRARLLDLVAGWLAMGLTCVLVKMTLGRPRPRYDDPSHFAGPLGLYPIDTGGHKVMRSPLAFWERGVADLWSMPSSHTAAAATLALFLAALYPRLRVVGICMVVLVAYARIALSDHGSHWPSDVLAGAALGLIIGGAAVRGRWGSRLVLRNGIDSRDAD